MPDYVTCREAAAELRYHPVYVRELVRAGRLQGDKKSGIWLIYRESLEAFKQAMAGKAKRGPRPSS